MYAIFIYNNNKSFLNRKKQHQHLFKNVLLPTATLRMWHPVEAIDSGRRETTDVFAEREKRNNNNLLLIGDEPPFGGWNTRR